MSPLLAFTIDLPSLLSAVLSVLFIFSLLFGVLFLAYYLVKKGLAWRKVALYGGLLLFVLCYPLVQPFVHEVANSFYGATPTTDALGNMNGAQVAADQAAGGAVPVGTVYTKLWITVLFYLLFWGLPWLLQRATHPGPTKWAKDDYTDDFNALPAPLKFENYGRLQLSQAIKIAAAGILAALIV